MDKNRLFAFMDAVIAIIMTILVLGLVAPKIANFREILNMWPQFSA